MEKESRKFILLDKVEQALRKMVASIYFLEMISLSAPWPKLPPFNRSWANSEGCQLYTVLCGASIAALLPFLEKSCALSLPHNPDLGPRGDLFPLSNS